MQTQRKHDEYIAYETQYRAGRENSSRSVRELLLRDSEEKFHQTLGKRAQERYILEIGCGDGSHSIFAAQAGAHVVGIDISDAAVKLARENAKRAGVADKTRFEVGDIEHLSHADESFDMVLDHEVFSSIDLKKALPEIHRVLRPGGILLGKETFGHNPLFNLQRQLKVLLGRRTSWAASHIFRQEDIAYLENSFRCVSLDYFHLISLFTAPLLLLPSNQVRESLLSSIRKTDSQLLQMRLFRRYAFKVLFEFEKPTSSSSAR